MLVGRDRELSELRAACERATRGHGSVHVIAGPPGIGKTRLADEVAAHASALGCEIHWGRAWETGGAPAYWPWSELLGSLARHVAMPAALAPIVARGERAAFGDARRADPNEARFTLFEAASTVLRDRAVHVPLLLVLDDLHAADVPSLELLAFVARGVRASRMLVVATWRDAEARLPPVADALARIAREGTVVRLAPLGRDDVTSLVREACGPDDSLAAAVHRHTEGNPLFVHEALQLLGAGSGPLEDRLAMLAASETVATVIRHRIARLAGEERALVTAIAVLGRELALDLVVEVSGAERTEVERRLAALVQTGVLERRGSDWVFAHVLVREALYERLAPEQRRALHAQVMRALERRIDGGAETLLATCAHHALAAIPVVPTEHALAIALRAAARARAQLAYEDAVTLLERAHAIADRIVCEPAMKFELVLALGWAALEAGRPVVARRAFEDAAASARGLGDPRLLARAALGCGAEFVLGDVRDQLVGLLREALAALPPTELELRARLDARLAAALVPGPDAAPAIDLARSAVQRVQGHGDDRLVLEVMLSAGSALAMDADPTETTPVNRELVHRARRLGDRVHELRGLARLVCGYLEAGDQANADATLSLHDELARSLKLPRYQWQSALFRSMRATFDGELAECDAAIAEAEALARQAGDDNAKRCLAMHRLWLLLLRDRTDELRAFEAEALRAIDTMAGAHTLQVMITAITAARGGDRSAARRALATLDRKELHDHGLMIIATIAEAAAEVDDPERLSALLDRLRPAAERTASWGLFGFAIMPAYAAYIGQLEAALGRSDDAERSFAAALSRARSMRAQLHEAWIRYWWGRAIPARSAEMLERAEALATTLGMDGLAARARDARRSAPPPRPVPASTAPPSVRREGELWVVEHAGTALRLRPLRGLAMLAQLVARPGVEIHAAELSAGPSDGEHADRGDAGELLDDRARQAYKQRLHALREELEEAQALGRVERAEQAHEEIEALSRELARAVGLGGRIRRAGSAAERARSNVQRRLREAIRQIEKLDPALGRHFDRAIKTGTFCVYDPE